MFGVPAKLPLRQQENRGDHGAQAQLIRPAEREHVVGFVLAQPARHHRNTHGRRGCDVGGDSPGRRQVVGEHRRHQPLHSRTVLFVDAPFGEHSLQRFRRGLDGDRPDTSGADHVGVIGEQFLDQAVHVMTIGEAVMNVEDRVRLSVADGQFAAGRTGGSRRRASTPTPTASGCAP